MPFTIEQFLDTMELYNKSIWPLQIAFNTLALIMIFFLFKNSTTGNKFISASLGFFWLWMGIVYHLVFFTQINNAAYGFGIIFIIQGLLFLYFGLIKVDLQFSLRKDWLGILSGIFILYALLIYPILGHYFGHTFPRNPTFGLPCPTTIFTFGLLLFTIKRVPWYLIIIPFIWSLIGTSAAINLTIYEDFGLGIIGVIGFVVLLLTNKTREAIEIK
ncbi:MAG: DUF6064 family protein [Melioribacteraceae bacterium]|nr:MAG: DUF6064 family protein [Melioribacteraceae bacterium]